MEKDVDRVRPSWDEYCMHKAAWNATRSSCVHMQTGAVIVRDKRVIAEGYNGAPKDIVNCLERGCRKDKYHIDFNDKGKGVCRGLHAEVNAIIQASNLMMALQGSTMYALHYPCSSCAKIIKGAGIIEVVYSKIYGETDSLTAEIFEEGGVKLRNFIFDYNKDFDMIRNIDK